jgi:hypothetical protein
MPGIVIGWRTAEGWEEVVGWQIKISTPARGPFGA